MTIWQPGMRCVCIVTIDPLIPGAALPKKGLVYTVLKIGICERSGREALMLAEIDNSHLVGSRFVVGGQAYYLVGELGFHSACFRPLAESKLDQFRAHLAPAPRKAVDAWRATARPSRRRSMSPPARAKRLGRTVWSLERAMSLEAAL